MNIALALEVKRRILAEPDRVDMGDWVETRYSDSFDFVWAGGVVTGGSTPCGTICCIAGHVIEVSGGDSRQVLDRGHVAEGPDIEDVAAALCGLTSKDAVQLFWFHTAHDDGGSPYHSLALKLAAFLPGTPQYACVVAEAIDLCIARNSMIPEPTPENVESALVSLAEAGWQR